MCDSHTWLGLSSRGGDDGDSSSIRFAKTANIALAILNPWALIKPPSSLWDERPTSLGLPSHGGDDGIRTHDPLLAGQVLSQLSYTPKGL